MARVQTDSDLVRDAQRGDRDAFSSLARRHQDRVYSLVRGIVRHESDAADVTQETWIAVLRHLDDFDRKAAFTTWLHRIAVRKAYDLLRKRVPTPVDDGVLEQAGRYDHTAAQLARGDLLNIIGALDVNFRAAVMLVDVMGISIDEVAATLEVPTGTVKSRVFRGRRELARQLGTLGYAGTS